MKKLYILLALALISCEKDENRQYPVQVEEPQTYGLTVGGSCNSPEGYIYCVNKETYDGISTMEPTPCMRIYFYDLQGVRRNGFLKGYAPGCN